MSETPIDPTGKGGIDPKTQAESVENSSDQRSNRAGQATGSQILIAQLVLEMLDLIADWRNRTLAPRHPEGPVLAIR